MRASIGFGMALLGLNPGELGIVFVKTDHAKMDILSRDGGSTDVRLWAKQAIDTPAR